MRRWRCRALRSDSGLTVASASTAPLGARTRNVNGPSAWPALSRRVLSATGPTEVSMANASGDGLTTPACSENTHSAAIMPRRVVCDPVPAGTGCVQMSRDPSGPEARKTAGETANRSGGGLSGVGLPPAGPPDSSAGRPAQARGASSRPYTVTASGSAGSRPTSSAARWNSGRRSRSSGGCRSTGSALIASASATRPSADEMRANVVATSSSTRAKAAASSTPRRIRSVSQPPTATVAADRRPIAAIRRNGRCRRSTRMC